MRRLSNVLGLLLVMAALLGCGGDDDSRPGTDGGEDGTTHEGGADTDGDTDVDAGDSATPCSDASFPNEGDLCTLADREADLACRACSCSTWCCPTCTCGEDLRWSCGVFCQDTGLDGGGETCDLGTPPRCRSSCAP